MDYVVCCENLAARTISYGCALGVDLARISDVRSY